MAIIQEHFITADEKERSGHLKKKNKKTKRSPKTYRIFNSNFSFRQKINFIFHKKPRQFVYKSIFKKTQCNHIAIACL